MPAPSASVVWDDRFRHYDFGPNHPFSETPRWLAVQLLDAWGKASPELAPMLDTPPFEPATEETLRLFHQASYVD